MQERTRHWLNSRGITDATIASFNISETEHPIMGPGAIQIPVNLPDGTFSFNKYRRDPFSEGTGAKYMYDKGGKTALYGADHMFRTPSGEPAYNPLNLTHRDVVITEGELDTLVLRGLNIMAVSSTGGAMSFQEEFTGLLANRDVYLCFDNDAPGAKGMVKTLNYLPDAKIMLLPQLPDCKDITDYIKRGGDFHALMRSAKSYASIEEVQEDMAVRKGQMLQTTFHEAYIEAHTPRPTTSKSEYVATGEMDEQKRKAKEFPCTEIIPFIKNKACCPKHNEKTPSMHYYSKTNSAYCFGCAESFDSIELYRAVHGVTFKEALKELSK